MTKVYGGRDVGKDPNRLVGITMNLPAWLADKINELAKEAGKNRSRWAEEKLREIIKVEPE